MVEAEAVCYDGFLGYCVGIREREELLNLGKTRMLYVKKASMA